MTSRTISRFDPSQDPTFNLTQPHAINVSAGHNLTHDLTQPHAQAVTTTSRFLPPLEGEMREVGARPRRRNKVTTEPLDELDDDEPELTPEEIAAELAEGRRLALKASHALADNEGWGPDYATLTPRSGWESAAVEVIYRCGNVHLITIPTLIKAFAFESDTDGMMRDFRPNEFYSGRLAEASREDGDDEPFTLTYDRFTAAAIFELKMEMCQLGILATRGTGYGVDLHLALPANPAKTPDPRNHCHSA